MKNILQLKNVLFVFILGALMMGFSSCTKYSFMSMEDKIVGKWRFENVEFIKGFSMSRRNATDTYAKWEYEFTQDGRFFMYNRVSSATYEGKWYMTVSTNYDPVDNTQDYFYDLHVSVYNPDTREIEQFIWEVSSITGKRLRATEYFSNETWYYTMYRL